jgi:hypothetical protein
VSLGAAVQEICTNGAELFGSATPGVMLQTYERLRDTVAGALDRLADENQMIWWVDRDGSLHMAATRPPAGLADGVRVDPQTDGSVTLVNPEGVVLGATYQGKPIRHIRWTMTADRQQAQIYFVPFLFPTPQKQTIYSCHYSAKVDTDNGDGTIDVIADGRFGVTKVPLMSGIPGSKITVKPGELVTLGFLGGNPRAPYAIAHGQISSAQKLVARKTDPITQGTLQFTYVPGSGPGVIVPGVLSITYTPGNGGPPQVLPLGSGTLTIGENIDGGSERVALDDG